MDHQEIRVLLALTKKVRDSILRTHSTFTNTCDLGVEELSKELNKHNIKHDVINGE